MLTLYEKLFLIAIDDARGTIALSTYVSLQYGLVGAILADLALHNKIGIDEDERLIVLDASPTGNTKLDETLGVIAASKHLRKPSRWIYALAVNKLVKQVAEGLAIKNIILIDEKRYHWVIPYEVYPQQQASAKYWVKNHLRSIVLGGVKSEPGAVALLSLLKACRLLNLVFTKDERKAASNKVNELVQGELFGQAVAKTLEEIELAAATAVLAAAS